METLMMSAASFELVSNGTELESQREYAVNSLKNLSPTGYKIAGVLLSFISVAGMFNNICVILVLSRRHLRTPINLMLLNLSAGDFIISCFGTPLTAVAAFMGRWNGGETLCKIYAFAMAVTGIGSITTLAAISIERYMLVKYAGSFTLTVRKTILVILAIWTYALSVTIPPLFGWNRFVLETPNIACAPNWESSEFHDRLYTVYLFSFGLVLPTCAIVFCYGNLIFVICKHVQQSGSGQGVAKNKKKVTVMIMVMIAVFLIAWLPYAIVSLIVVFGYGESITAEGATAPAIFAKASIIYNPIIYVFMNPQIRMAIFTLLTCGKVAEAERAPIWSERVVREKTLQNRKPIGMSKAVYPSEERLPLKASPKLQGERTNGAISKSVPNPNPRHGLPHNTYPITAAEHFQTV